MRQRARSLLGIGRLAIVLAAIVPGCATEPEEVIVDGTVRLHGGPPVAGALVSFFEPAPASAGAPRRTPTTRAPRLDVLPPTMAITDANGRYSLRIHAGRYEVWVGGMPDGGFMGQKVADVGLHHEHTTVNLDYNAYRVSGRMIGPGGTVITNGDVFVLSATNTALARIVSGGFSLLLPADTYMLWANPAAEYVGIPRVRHDGIAVRSDTTIDLSVDGYAVTGTLTNWDGAPLEGGWVTGYADGASAYGPTASDGTYRIYLPPREYGFLAAPAPGNEYVASRTFPPRTISGPTVVDLAMTSVAWSGVARNRITGNPETAVIDVYTEDPRKGPSAWYETSSDGRFRFFVEPSQTYIISWEPLDHAFPRSTIQGVRAGSDSTFDLPVPLPAP